MHNITSSTGVPTRMKVLDIFRKENVQVLNPGNIAGRMPLVTEPAARLGARLGAPS